MNQKDKSITKEKANTKAINVTNTASINCHSKKVRDIFYITIYLPILRYMLYFTYRFIGDDIAIDNYYCLLSLCKTNRYNIKLKMRNSKKFVSKIVRVLFR